MRSDPFAIPLINFIKSSFGAFDKILYTLINFKKYQILSKIWKFIFYSVPSIWQPSVRKAYNSISESIIWYLLRILRQIRENECILCLDISFDQ